MQRSKLDFYAKGGLPGVFGAVGGTHVRLWEPKPAALAYMNRKGFHSVNVMVRLQKIRNIKAVILVLMQHHREGTI